MSIATAQASTWTGKSGKKYVYYAHPIKNDGFRSAAGNYIFAKLQANTWVPIYVGQTEDLGSRFTNHHQEACVDRNGATHILLHLNSSGKQARLDEETDLRNQYNPPCNQQ